MEQAVRARPERPLPGRSRIQAGGSESKATGAYRKALEASPGEAEAAQNLAAILRGQGDEAEAEKVLRSCLAAAPDSIGVSLDLARLELDLGHAADALPLLEKALEKDSASGLTQLLYGRALAASGRGPDAVPYLRRARSALHDAAARGWSVRCCSPSATRQAARAGAGPRLPNPPRWRCTSAWRDSRSAEATSPARRTPSPAPEPSTPPIPSSPADRAGQFLAGLVGALLVAGSDSWRRKMRRVMRTLPSPVVRVSRTQVDPSAESDQRPA